jgi:hypothetical protein
MKSVGLVPGITTHFPYKERESVDRTVREEMAQIADRERNHTQKTLTLRAGLVERLIGREDLSGDEAAAALAALLRSLGFEMVTVVFEQPPAT